MSDEKQEQRKEILIPTQEALELEFLIELKNKFSNADEINTALSRRQLISRTETKTETKTDKGITLEEIDRLGFFDKTGKLTTNYQELQDKNQLKLDIDRISDNSLTFLSEKTIKDMTDRERAIFETIVFDTGDVFNYGKSQGEGLHFKNIVQLGQDESKIDEFDIYKERMKNAKNVLKNIEHLKLDFPDGKIPSEATKKELDILIQNRINEINKNNLNLLSPHIIQEIKFSKLLDTYYPYGKIEKKRAHKYEATLDPDTKKNYIDSKEKYAHLQGDHLKRVILESFQEKIQKTTSKEELIALEEKLKASAEYDILKKSQDWFTKYVGKTTSIKTLGKMIEEKKGSLPNEPSNKINQQDFPMQLTAIANTKTDPNTRKTIDEKRPIIDNSRVEENTRTDNSLDDLMNVDGWKIKYETELNKILNNEDNTMAKAIIDRQSIEVQVIDEGKTKWMDIKKAVKENLIDIKEIVPLINNLDDKTCERVRISDANIKRTLNTRFTKIGLNAELVDKMSLADRVKYDAALFNAGGDLNIEFTRKFYNDPTIDPVKNNEKVNQFGTMLNNFQITFGKNAIQIDQQKKHKEIDYSNVKHYPDEDSKRTNALFKELSAKQEENKSIKKETVGEGSEFPIEERKCNI